MQFGRLEHAGGKFDANLSSSILCLLEQIIYADRNKLPISHSSPFL